MKSFQTLYYWDMATADNILNDMTGQIVRRFQPMQIILFGSRARGDAGPNSDVDLLVVLPDAKNRRETTIEIRRALAGFPAAKDIIVTTPEARQLSGDSSAVRSAGR
jgi:uncharacterized protein